MKKTARTEPKDELRAEYNFGELGGGIRGKYAEGYGEGTNLVLLEPDVAKAFPTDESVNEALRILVQIAGRQRA